MIVTNNAIYLNLPRTASQWIKKVLSPIKIPYEDDYLTHSMSYSRLWDSTLNLGHSLPLELPSQKFVYTFIRNPWDWHASQYIFFINGSSLINSHQTHTLKNRFIPNTTSFEDFIDLAVNPTIDYKNYQFNIERIEATSYKKKSCSYYFFQQWLEREEPIYNHLYNFYTKYTTRVGKYENLKQELIYMTTECNDLNNLVHDNIINTPIINSSINKKDYREYYTDKTRKIIEVACEKIIKDYNYEF